MNLWIEKITAALSSYMYVTVGDESLGPMLEELASGSGQSRIPSSAGKEEPQAVSVVRIPTTMPFDLRAMLVICAIHLGKTLPEVSIWCVFEPVICGQIISVTCVLV